MVDGAEREEGPAAGEVQPTLLQELANVDPPYGASAYDEVVLDGEDEAAADANDDEAPAKAGIPTGTKVVVVAAAWLLLTLFLVDRFSHDPAANGSTRLDQVAADEDENEAPADEEQGEDGDESDDGWGEDAGAGEAGVGAGGYAEALAATGADPVAGGAGSGGVYPGVPAQVSGGVGGGSAAPGAAPAATSSTAPAGPAAPGGGSATTAPSTGATTTTTMVAPGGGGSGGGGGSTHTTAAPAPPEYTITILANKQQGKWVYDTADLSVPSGSLVRMVNESSTAHTWKIGDGTAIELPAKGSTGYRTFTTTVTFACTRHDYMRGKVTVT